MKKWFISLVVALGCVTSGYTQEDEVGCQVPIAPHHRVYNRSGWQCLYASLETLGRHWNDSRLIGLTNDPAFQGLAHYHLVSKMLTDRGIANTVLEPHPTTHQESRLSALPERHAGIVFGIKIPIIVHRTIFDPNDGQFKTYTIETFIGHAMTMVHYDVKGGIVKFIDNTDPKLRVQTWTLDEFRRRWDGMAIIIHH